MFLLEDVDGDGERLIYRSLYRIIAGLSERKRYRYTNLRHGSPFLLYQFTHMLARKTEKVELSWKAAAQVLLGRHVRGRGHGREGVLAEIRLAFDWIPRVCQSDWRLRAAREVR